MATCTYSCMLRSLGASRCLRPHVTYGTPKRHKLWPRLRSVMWDGLCWGDTCGWQHPFAGGNCVAKQNKKVLYMYTYLLHRSMNICHWSVFCVDRSFIYCYTDRRNPQFSHRARNLLYNSANQANIINLQLCTQAAWWMDTDLKHVMRPAKAMVVGFCHWNIAWTLQ